MKNPFLYFDLGNVLVFFDHERAVQNLKYFCEVSEDEIRPLLNDSALKDDYEKGLVTTESAYEQFCELAKCRATLEEFKIGVSDIFTLNPSILPLLSCLKTAGYQMGILSNTCEAHWQFLESRITVLNQFFDCRILSYEIKSMKPESKIYEAAADELGRKTSEFWFTDDREENVEGAIACGWQAVRFDDVRQLNSALQGISVTCNY